MRLGCVHCFRFDMTMCNLVVRLEALNELRRIATCNPVDLLMAIAS